MINGRNLQTRAAVTWYLVVGVAVPIMVLAVAGLVWAWRQGLLIPMLLIWLGITSGAWLALWLWLRRASTQVGSATSGESDSSRLPTDLPAPAAWTSRDTDVFDKARALIEADTDASLDINILRDRARDVVALVAAEYKGNTNHSELAFTLPEGLLMLTVVSQRYRTLVLSHVPFADKITVARLFGIAQQRTRIERGATWINRIRRGARLINPVAAVISEVREQLTGQVLAHISDALRRDLVRLLLQEVAQVAIDLYAGHLQASDLELSEYRSRAALNDESRQAAPTEPIRVVLVGQSGAGKSSLINALAKALVAEVDTLPATAELTTYSLTSEGLPPLSLIDTQGLDDTPATRTLATEALKDADLVVWLAKANQPGRAADAQLQAAWHQELLANPGMRIPPTLMVLTHIDQLPPLGEWSPPYVLGNSGSDKREEKAIIIERALDSAHRSIGLDDSTPGIPTRLDAPFYYNVDTVASAIALASEEALQTQLNRRRLDHKQQRGGWRKRLEQSKNLALGLTQLYTTKKP